MVKADVVLHWAVLSKNIVWTIILIFLRSLVACHLWISLWVTETSQQTRTQNISWSDAEISCSGNPVFLSVEHILWWPFFDSTWEHPVSTQAEFIISWIHQIVKMSLSSSLYSRKSGYSRIQCQQTNQSSSLQGKHYKYLEAYSDTLSYHSFRLPWTCMANWCIWALQHILQHFSSHLKECEARQFHLWPTRT